MSDSTNASYMSNASGRSISREIKYWIIILLVLALFFEMISSMVFYRKYGAEKLAIIQLTGKFFEKGPELSLYHKMHEMTRPDSAPAVSRNIADQIWEANNYSYEPWLMFKVTDYQSTFVNVNGFQRKCIPSEFINTVSNDTVDIYFFGGSTMYGWNVSDAETIPSQFLELYRNKYPHGKSVRIRNYGIPYYYTKQELLLLSKLIFEGERPDMVIFMDGLNDFYPSRMLYYDKPHFSYAMQQVFDESMFYKTRRTIVDTSEQFYIDPPGIPSENYYQQLHDKYLNNISHATNLAYRVGAKSYFFCQPVPFYNYPNRQNDPISYKMDYPRYNYIYPRLQQKADSLHNFVFLGNMLENEKDLPFIDQVHYSPKFSRKIAEKIFLKVEQDLINH
jgi:lysophospholipase L1-like esterase